MPDNKDKKKVQSSNPLFDYLTPSGSGSVDYGLGAFVPTENSPYQENDAAYQKAASAQSGTYQTGVVPIKREITQTPNLNALHERVRQEVLEKRQDEIDTHQKAVARAKKNHLYSIPSLQDSILDKEIQAVTLEKQQQGQKQLQQATNTMNKLGGVLRQEAAPIKNLNFFQGDRGVDVAKNGVEEMQKIGLFDDKGMPTQNFVAQIHSLAGGNPSKYQEAATQIATQRKEEIANAPTKWQQAVQDETDAAHDNAVTEWAESIPFAGPVLSTVARAPYYFDKMLGGTARALPHVGNFLTNKIGSNILYDTKTANEMYAQGNRNIDKVFPEVLAAGEENRNALDKAFSMGADMVGSYGPFATLSEIGVIGRGLAVESAVASEVPTLAARALRGVQQIVRGLDATKAGQFTNSYVKMLKSAYPQMYASYYDNALKEGHNENEADTRATNHALLSTAVMTLAGSFGTEAPAKTVNKLLNAAEKEGVQKFSLRLKDFTEKTLPAIKATDAYKWGERAAPNFISAAKGGATFGAGGIADKAMSASEDNKPIGDLLSGDIRDAITSGFLFELSKGMIQGHGLTPRSAQAHAAYEIMSNPERYYQAMDKMASNGEATPQQIAQAKGFIERIRPTVNEGLRSGLSKVQAVKAGVEKARLQETADEIVRLSGQDGLPKGVTTDAATGNPIAIDPATNLPSEQHAQKLIDRLADLKDKSAESAKALQKLQEGTDLRGRTVSGDEMATLSSKFTPANALSVEQSKAIAENGPYHVEQMPVSEISADELTNAYAVGHMGAGETKELRDLLNDRKNAKPNERGDINARITALEQKMSENADVAKAKSIADRGLKEPEHQNPIVLDADGGIVDGRKRLAYAIASGQKNIEVARPVSMQDVAQTITETHDNILPNTPSAEAHYPTNPTPKDNSESIGLAKAIFQSHLQDTRPSTEAETERGLTSAPVRAMAATIEHLKDDGLTKPEVTAAMHEITGNQYPDAVIEKMYNENAKEAFKIEDIPKDAPPTEELPKEIASADESEVEKIDPLVKPDLKLAESYIKPEYAFNEQEPAIDEIAKVKEDLKTKTDERTIESFEQRTADEVEKSEPIVEGIESKAESNNEAELNDAVKESDAFITGSNIDNTIKLGSSNILVSPEALKAAGWDANSVESLRRKFAKASGDDKVTLAIVDKDSAGNAMRSNTKGWYDRDTNTIYLNIAKASPTTALHEFSHFWTSWAKANAPEIHAKGQELAKDTEAYKYVEAKWNGTDFKPSAGFDKALWDRYADAYKGNKDRTGDLAEEILTQTIEKEANNLQPAERTKFKQWLKQFFDQMKGKFGFGDLTAQQFARLKLEDFTKHALAELGGDKEWTRNVAERDQMFSLDEGTPEAEIKAERADIETKAKADGTWLKAPNGKDTNLTESQWLSTRTKRFKEWFGDWENDLINSSKVVDKNGEPLLVFHGTTEGDISVFKRPSEEGYKRNERINSGTKDHGIYFTSDRGYGGMYGKPSTFKKPSHIHEVFLNIKNPYFFEGTQRLSFNNAVSRLFGNKLAKSVFAIHENPLQVNPISVTNEAKIKLDAQNHDGIQYGKSWIEAVVFNPEQIKSVDNVGTYSKDTGDIRYSLDNPLDPIPESDRDSLKKRIDAGKIDRSILATYVADKYGISKDAANDALRSLAGEVKPEVAAKKPDSNSQTSIRNEQTDIERQQLGMSPAMQSAKYELGDKWDAAIKILDTNPEASADLVNELRNEIRGVNGAETALLLHRQVALRTERRKLTEQINDLAAHGDVIEKAAADARLAYVDKELEDIYDIDQKVGSFLSEGLNTRRLVANEDYSLAAMKSRERAVKGGKPLSEQATKELEALSKRLEEADRKIEELEKKKAGKKSLVGQKLPEYKETRRKSILDGIRKKLGLDAPMMSIDPSSKILPDNIRNEIKQLASLYTNLNSKSELVDSVHSDLSELFPNLTKAEVEESIFARKKPFRTEEAKNNAAMAAVQKSIDEYQRRIDEKDLSPREKLLGATPSPEVLALRAERDKLKREFQQMVKDANAKSPEETALEAFKKRVEKATDLLKERTANGDFDKKPPKKELELDDEANRLTLEQQKARHEFDVRLEKYRLSQRSLWEKVKDTAVDVANLPKALLSTIDMSAPLRQGVILGAGNPKEFVAASGEMFRQAFSQQRADLWLNKLQNSAIYPLMQRSKLYIAKPSAKLTAKEEQFMSNIALKIPVYGKLVAGSERAYAGFLNKIRADVFAKGVDQLKKAGISDPKAFKELAQFINDASGRGNLGSLEKSAATLNALMFSPRMLASRLNLINTVLNPAKFMRMNPVVRKIAMKNMLSFLAFGATVLAMARFAGAETEEDSRSADFGKIKIGDTRFDIFAGFLPIIRTIAQAATAQRKSTRDGSIIEMNGKGHFGEDRTTPLTKFARSKASPIVGSAINLAIGKDMVGQDVTVGGELIKNVTPLYIQDVYNVLSDETDGGGLMGAAETAIPSFFGVGVQRYSSNKKKSDK